MTEEKIRSHARWLPVLIVAMTLVAILVGAFALHFVERSLVDAAGKSLALAAVDIADKVDILMGERYGDIKLFSRSMEFQGHDLEAMGRKVFELLESYPVYRWVGVTDGNGLVLVATDGTSKGRDLSGDLGFLAVRERQRIVVQDAASDGEGVPGVTFLSPIHDAKGAFIGAVITQLGLPTLEDAFTHSLGALQVQWGTGAHIEYQFLDHDGNVFVDSFLREQGHINLKRQGVLSAQLVGTVPAGFIEERHGRRDVDVVTGYAQTKGTEDLQGLGWGVLLRMDRSDILASTEAVLWKVGAAGSAIFVPLVGVLFWSITRLTRSWKLAGEERNRAQAAERKFRRVLEMAPDAIMMTDVEGNIVLANQQADRMFDCPPGQLIGQPVDILVPEAVWNVHRTLREHNHASPQTSPMEAGRTHTGRRQDGTEFPIQVSVVHIETAEDSFAVAILRDLSQEHMQQDERERLSRDIRLLLDSTVGGLYGIDPQGCCTFINRAGAALLGYQPDKLLGKDMHELIHHSHKDGLPYPIEACSIYRACLAGEGGQIDDEVLWRRDGTCFPSEIASRPIYENGLLKGAVVTFTDISERKQAEEALRLAKFSMDRASDAIYWIDSQAKILDVNEAASLMLGYSKEELCAMTVHDLNPDFQADRWPGFWAETQRRGTMVMETFHRAKNGRLITVEVSINYLSYEGNEYHCAFVRDITERKQTEAQFKLVVEAAPNGLLIVDQQGTITLINTQVEQLFGYSRQELIDRPVELLIPERFRTQHPNFHAGFFKSPTPRAMGAGRDLFGLRKDGTEFSVEIGLTPLNTPNGTRVLASIVDITLRKLAEKEQRLREAELQRFKSTLDQTHDCVFMFAPDTLRFIYCNRGAVEQVGYTEAELFTMTPVDIKPQFTERSFRELLQPLRDGDMASLVFETVHRHKEGHTVAVEVSLQLVREEQGGEGRFIAVVRDITERKQIEEELKIRASWQKAVLDYAGYAIIATTPDGVIQTFNRAAERMLGYRAEEVIGKMSPAVIHDPQEVEDRAKTFSMELGERIEPGFEVFVAKTRKDLPNEYEWTYIRKDGTRFPVLLSVTALKGSSGEITGFLGLALDITDRKQSEAAFISYAQELEIINQSLDVALDQAEAATVAKSAFLATMSHEIRTPMNGVIGMTGLLLDTDLTPEQREFAETVRLSGDHLLTVINDILDFSKIEAGKMDLEIIDFDLRTAVDETVDLLAERASSKGLNLACLFHADVPTALRGDPGRLRQVLINLLGNAIKFTEQGDVVLSVTLMHQTDTDATVRFEVQDTGIGLSPDAQGRLFQSFSQADSSTTRKFGGTGLGLAICKQLTKLMGGQIGVDSKLGEGSTFWFTVQLGKQPQATASVAAMASQDLRGLLFCIVDDSPFNRRILESYATKWGARCLIAENGRQALAVLRKVAAQGYACDFAIINMQLPGMDGLELARAIKADPMLAPTRLVLLTHQGQRGDAQAAHTAGYAAYLRRPVHESQLYECLVTLCVLSASATAREGQSGDQTVRPALVTRHSLAEAKAQATAKILVAEDNVVNQKVALRILEKLGYRADLVANGLEVLDALERITYDAVLMDCQMPEMDGFAATAEIRRREALSVKREAQDKGMRPREASFVKREAEDEIQETCDAPDVKGETPLVRETPDSGTKYASRFTYDALPRRIPIIAMTANAMQEDRDRCLAAGMDDYLSKPVQPKVLAEILARWVSAPPSISNLTDDRPLQTASKGTAA